MKKPNNKPAMDNLIDGLDEHAQFLSQEQLKAELESRGIDVGGFLKRAHDIIAKHLKPTEGEK